MLAISKPDIIAFWGVLCSIPPQCLKIGCLTHSGVSATGHTPTPSRFRATFRVGGWGRGGRVWWGG